MGTDLFRVLVDEPNYSEVLGNPVNRNQRELLTSITGREDSLRIWGLFADTKVSTYDQMKSGDGLLFYKKKKGLADDEQMYVGTGIIGEMFREDSETAEALFQTSRARLMFTVEDFVPIREPIAEVHDVFGFENAHPQTTQIVKSCHYTTVDQVFEKLRQ